MEFSKQFRLFPQSASSISGTVDALTWVLLIASAITTLAVFLMVVYFALRYRRRTEDEIPEEAHSHYVLETGWTIAIFIAFITMFAYGARAYVEMKKPAQDALEIQVIGKQWMWKIQHPGGQREIDELHIPVGRPIKLIMTSQDVIHSFGIPAFRITQDVIPGSYSTEWFTATKVGEYHLFCREFCGMGHSQMVGRVVVMEPQDYQAWLSGAPHYEPPVNIGARLFLTYGCAQCHGQTAPTLAGLYGRSQPLEDGSTVIADESYIRESILNPPAKVVAGYSHLMPSYKAILSEEQVGQLVAYIKSLGAASTTQPAPARLDVAAPATQPVNGFSPDQIPNIPPAPQPPGVFVPPPRPGGGPPS